MKPRATPVEIEEYPSGDGKPMAETWIHVQAIMLLHQAMQDFFAGRPDVWIASNIFWYWERGNRRAKLSPDCMVIPGVGQRVRRSYLGWEENGIVPAAVFEISSAKTIRVDEGTKLQTYQQLGVREYFLFDPDDRILQPALQGYRLRGGVYQPIRASRGELRSRLGFGLRAEGNMLRVLTSEGVPLPTRAEAIERERRRAEQAQTTALQAQNLTELVLDRVDALQAEVERLKDRLGKLGHANGNGS